MADLQVDSIASSGGGLETLTNEVVKRSGPVIAQGVATFTNSNNNINLAGLGVHPEVGDVLLISGSVNNSGAFTVEVITDNDNVIVNQAHAGKSRTVAPIGTKALIDETVTCTIELLCKWYLAPIGLGQGKVDVWSDRLSGIEYSNDTGRTIKVSVGGSSNVFADRVATLYVDGVLDSIAQTSLGTDGAISGNVKGVIGANSTYTVTHTIVQSKFWTELR